MSRFNDHVRAKVCVAACIATDMTPEQKAWANDVTQALEEVALEQEMSVNWSDDLKELVKMANEAEYLGGTDLVVDDDCFLAISVGYGDVYITAAVMQEYLKKFEPDGVNVLRWAETCSSPRVGSFRGGVVLVTADFMYTPPDPEDLIGVYERVKRKYLDAELCVDAPNPTVSVLNSKDAI